MHGQRIGYVRVSSFDQNPERQHEHVPIDRLFSDKASGKDRQRLELERFAGHRAPGRHGGGAQHGPAGAQPRRPAAHRAEADQARRYIRTERYLFEIG